jgi:dienelactone hydrolase
MLGEEAEFISKTAQAQIKAALAKKPNATVYSHSSQRHAFSRHNGAHYNAAAALANGRTPARECIGCGRQKCPINRFLRSISARMT